MRSARNQARFGDIVAAAGLGSTLCGFASSLLSFLALIVLDGGPYGFGLLVIFVPLLGALLGFLIAWLPAIAIGWVVFRMLGAGIWQSAVVGYLCGSALLLTLSGGRWPDFTSFELTTTIAVLASAPIMGVLAWKRTTSATAAHG